MNRMTVAAAILVFSAFAAVIVAFSTAVLTPTATAHADNASYLQYLRDHGQTVLPWMEGSWLTSGQMVCSQLRNGQSPQQIYPQFTFGSNPVIGVEAAQRELCPDTLRR